MKREFLKNLGIEEDTINKIMAENGNDITTLKTKVATLEDDIKVKDGVINEKNTKISELEKVDVEAEKKAEYERGKLEGNTEIEKFKLQSALESKLKDAKVKDVKTISGLIDMEKIKLENGEIKGLDEQITPLKESHNYLFEGDKPSGGFIKVGAEGSNKEQQPNANITLSNAIASHYGQ